MGGKGSGRPVGSCYGNDKGSPKGERGPYLLTPTVRKKFVDCIKNGMPQNHAWGAVGIGTSTGEVWLRHGKRCAAEGVKPGDDHPQEPCVRLYVEMIKARGNTRRDLYAILKAHIDETQDFDKAFAFLRHLEARDNQTAAREAGQQGGMGDYKPPPVGE